MPQPLWTLWMPISRLPCSGVTLNKICQVLVLYVGLCFTDWPYREKTVETNSCARGKRTRSFTASCCQNVLTGRLDGGLAAGGVVARGSSHCEAHSREGIEGGQEETTHERLRADKYCTRAAHRENRACGGFTIFKLTVAPSYGLLINHELVKLTVS